MSSYTQRVFERPLPYARWTIPGIYPAIPRLRYGVDYLDRMIVKKPIKAKILKIRKPTKANWTFRDYQKRTISI